MTKPGLSTLATEKLTPDLDEWEQPDATVAIWALREGQPIPLARTLAALAKAVESLGRNYEQKPMLLSGALRCPTAASISHFITFSFRNATASS